MSNHEVDRLFGVPPCEPGSRIAQREMDIACSIQAATEGIVLSQRIHSGRARYDVVFVDSAAVGNSAPRAKERLVARIDSLVERIGVARAPMLGIAHNER